MAARLGGGLISVAVALVILGLAAVPFANLAWIHFEQDRAGVTALTGYAAPDARAATDGIVRDLVFGGSFDVTVAGSPVLDANERGHMQDVRVVFGGFVLAVAAAALLLLVAAVRLGGRSADAAWGRTRAWGAIRRGATWLAGLIVVLGVIAALAFDTAFEVFHQVFFPGGNYDFDPRTEKMVQLFPVQFWSDTAFAFGAVALVLAVGLAWYAGGRASA